MARDKKTRSNDESGDELQEGSGSDARGGNGSSSRVSSKADAARAALAQGIEAPRKAVEYIRSQFGIDMDAQHFSAFKSGLRKKEREAEALAPSPKRRSRAVEGFLAPPPKPSAGVDAGDGDLLAALETMKPLIAQYGSDKVKRIVDLLG